MRVIIYVSDCSLKCIYLVSQQYEPFQPRCLGNRLRRSGTIRCTKVLQGKRSGGPGHIAQYKFVVVFIIQLRWKYLPCHAHCLMADTDLKRAETYLASKIDRAANIRSSAYVTILSKSNGSREISVGLLPGRRGLHAKVVGGLFIKRRAMLALMP